MKLPGDKLKAALKQLGWSNEQLADELGVRVETVYHWTKGKVRIPGKVASFIEASLKHKVLKKELDDALATSFRK